jgi:hypothetical protein
MKERNGIYQKMEEVKDNDIRNARGKEDIETEMKRERSKQNRKKEMK